MYTYMCTHFGRSSQLTTSFLEKAQMHASLPGQKLCLLRVVTTNLPLESCSQTSCSRIVTWDNFCSLLHRLQI